MQLLLDSHILLWALGDRKKLRVNVLKAILEPGASVYVSAISIAELHIKCGLGKLDIDAKLEHAVVDSGFMMLPFRSDQAHWLSELPLHHRDPFDRMLIAQALEDGLTLVTSDKQLSAYPVTLLLN
jgi:PIN domain nuclease of toxin-antitoxin system